MVLSTHDSVTYMPQISNINHQQKYVEVEKKVKLLTQMSKNEYKSMCFLYNLVKKMKYRWTMEKGFFTSSLFHFFLSFLAHLTLYACGHHLHMRTHIHKLDVRERERER